MDNMNQDLPNTLVVLYTDLNIDILHDKFKSFQEKVKSLGWHILIPKECTRKGYGFHRDSTIDYILIS